MGTLVPNAHTPSIDAKVFLCSWLIVLFVWMEAPCLAGSFCPKVGRPPPSPIPPARALSGQPVSLGLHRQELQTHGSLGRLQSRRETRQEYKAAAPLENNGNSSQWPEVGRTQTMNGEMRCVCPHGGILGKGRRAGPGLGAEGP